MKKVLTYLLNVCALFVSVSLLNASNTNAFASIQEFTFYDDHGGGSGTYSYYIPETWFERVKNSSQGNRKLLHIKSYDKYVFPWFRNYHRLRWYNEVYTDTYITSKIFSVRHNKGVATYNLAAS